MLKNRNRITTRFPKAEKMVNHLSSLNNVAFGIAVAEEFLIILFATLLVLSVADASMLMWMWIGLFGAFSLHLLVHMAQAVMLHSYVPGVVTSVLMLPYCAYVMHSIALVYPLWGIAIATLAGALFAAANLLAAHRLGTYVSQKLKNTTYCLL